MPAIRIQISLWIYHLLVSLLISSVLRRLSSRDCRLCPSHIDFNGDDLKVCEQAGDEEAVKIPPMLWTPSPRRLSIIESGAFPGDWIPSLGREQRLLSLSKSIRTVRPLITAVVVVFVTSDAWRMLGAGFTSRFFCL